MRTGFGSTVPDGSAAEAVNVASFSAGARPQIHYRHRRRLAVGHRARQPEKLTLPNDCQGMGLVDHRYALRTTALMSTPSQESFSSADWPIVAWKTLRSGVSNVGLVSPNTSAPRASNCCFHSVSWWIFARPVRPPPCHRWLPSRPLVPRMPPRDCASLSSSPRAPRPPPRSEVGDEPDFHLAHCLNFWSPLYPIQHIANGKTTGAIDASVHQEEARKKTLLVELTRLDQLAHMPYVNENRFVKELRTRLGDIPGVLTRQVLLACQMLRTLLDGHISCGSAEEGEKRGYRFTATGTLDRLLMGVTVINQSGGGQGS